MKIKSVVLTVPLLVLLAGCSRSPATYVAAGNKYFAQGRYDDAILQYRKAVQKDQHYAEGYYRLGLLDMRRGNFSSAYALLKRTVELAPEWNQASVQYGDLVWYIYKVDNRPAPALYMELSRVSQKLLSANPRDFDGLRFKGYIAILDKHLDEALALLQQADSIRPSYSDVTMPLAELLIAKGDSAKAEALIRQMLAKTPSYGAGYDAVYLLCMRAHRIADAEAILRQRVEKNPNDSAARIRLADHYFYQNNKPGMDSALRPLVENPSGFQGSRVALADFYALHKMAGEALRELQRAIQEDPKNQIVYRKKAVTILIAEGKRGEAQAALDEILKQDPKDVDGLRLRAGFDLASQEEKKLGEAVNIYRELSAERPNDADVRFYYARSLLASGDVQKATSELSAAVQGDPRKVAPKLQLASIFLNQGRFGEAQQLTADVIDRDPNNETAHLLHAIAMGSLGARGEARSELNTLLRSHSGNTDAELQLGLLDVAEKHYPEATAIFTKLYHPGQPDLRPLEGLVRTLVAQGQLEKALSSLDQEARKSPQSQQLKMITASVAVAGHKYDLAEAQYRALAATSPNSSAIELQWAEVLHAKGDSPGAIEHYQKAKALDPKHPNPAALLGRELAIAGRNQEAIAAYRDALKVSPEDVFALNNLAYLLAESGQNLDEALKMAQDAQHLIKGNSAVDDTLGWVYLKKGLTGSAVQVFQTIVQKEPKNVTYRCHLAAALLASGERVRAKEELHKALEDGPSPPEAQTIGQLLAKIG